MPAKLSAASINLPLSIVGLTQLEEARVALERSLDGASEQLQSLDARTQDWLAHLVQASGGEAALQALEVCATTAPVYDIELAVVPTDELREVITAWVRTQISPTILIRIHIRRNILAGLKLRSGKREYDRSLASRLAVADRKMQEILHAN